jgi:hypothetical protein
MSSLRALSLVVFAPLALAACGRGGTVALELTDAPPNITAIKSVEVTLGKVEIHASHACGGKGDRGGARDQGGEERGEWIAVSESAGTFDLLSLRNDVTAPLGEVEVWGEIDRIRTHIDTTGKNQVVLQSGQTCALDTSGIGPGGIDIGHAFEPIEAPRGGRATVVVDFDLEQSLDQNGPCSFVLAPVFAIKRVEEVADE